MRLNLDENAAQTEHSAQNRWWFFLENLWNEKKISKWTFGFSRHAKKTNKKISDFRFFGFSFLFFLVLARRKKNHLYFILFFSSVSFDRRVHSVIHKLKFHWCNTKEGIGCAFTSCVSTSALRVFSELFLRCRCRLTNAHSLSVCSIVSIFFSRSIDENKWAKMRQNVWSFDGRTLGKFSCFRWNRMKRRSL